MLDIEGVMLAEKFRELLEQERQAEGVYAGLSEQVTDPAAREHIQQIHREKLRHVQLVERLIEIVE